MKRSSKFIRSFSYELIGLSIILAIGISSLFFNKLIAIISISAALIYALFLFLIYRTGKNRIIRERGSNAMTQMIAELMENIDSPVMVVNEVNKIIWCNNEFLALNEISEKQLSNGIAKLFGGSISYGNLKTA